MLVALHGALRPSSYLQTTNAAHVLFRNEHYSYSKTVLHTAELVPRGLQFIISDLSHLDPLYRIPHPQGPLDSAINLPSDGRMN